MRSRIYSSLCKVLIASAVVTAISACASTDEDMGSRDFDAVIGDWSLTHIADERVAAEIDSAKAVLTIAPDGGVSGFSGVNRYTGQLELEEARNGRWRLGPMAVTRMAGPPELMDFETAFLRELEAASLFLVINGTLVLDRDGVARLNFTPAGSH